MAKKMQDIRPRRRRLCRRKAAAGCGHSKVPRTKKRPKCRAGTAIPGERILVPPSGAEACIEVRSLARRSPLAPRSQLLGKNGRLRVSREVEKRVRVENDGAC